MDKPNSYYEIDFLQLLRALWNHALIIIIAAVIGAGSMFAVSAYAIEPKYKSEALMYVNNSSLTLGSAKLSLSDISAAKSLVDTYIVILQSRSTLNKVISESGVNRTTGELKDMITASQVNGTEVFTVQVTSTNPQEAELIANTVATVLPDKISEIVDGSSVRIVDYAIVPTVKSSPSITKYTAIGMLVGIVLACAFIIIKDMTDTLIHHEDYLMQTYKVPVLAVIPNLFEAGNNKYYSSYSANPKAKE